MTLFVFSIENRVTYACFKHNVYVVTSKMADHSKCVQSILTTIWPYLNVSKLCIIMELTVSWKLPIKRVSSLLLCQVFFSLFLVLLPSELNGSMKDPNKFYVYETEKITRKASDAAECIELFTSFTRDRHARCN